MKKVYCKKCKWIINNSYKHYCYHPSNFRIRTKEDPIYGFVHEKTFKGILCCDKNKDFNCADFKLNWWRKFI
jgi:hypothetical protein